MVKPPFFGQRQSCCASVCYRTPGAVGWLQATSFCLGRRVAGHKSDFNLTTCPLELAALFVLCLRGLVSELDDALQELALQRVAARLRGVRDCFVASALRRSPCQSP
jgi:hypothetical protein